MMEDSIKISPKPFIFIALFLIAAVLLGSVMNYFRMRNRFDSLVDHSKVIYKAHFAEIDSLFKKEENLSEMQSVLENINAPEKNVYQIDIIRKIGESWVIYDPKNNGYNGNYSDIDKSIVNQKDIDLIQDYIKIQDNSKFSYQKNLKDFYNNHNKYYLYYNNDYLISIIPIEQENKTVGYFIVGTSKIQAN